jgi:hypothetical protein
MDGDGDTDLLVGGYYDEVWYYPNTAGPGVLPSFGPPVELLSDLFADNVPGGDIMIALTMVDWDADGDVDLVAGAATSGVRVFWNTGDATAMSFNVSSYQQLLGPAEYSYHSPTHADWDNDGDWDLLVGTYDGYVQFHENQSGTFVNHGQLSTTLGPIDVSYYARPDVVDWNNDGTYDLLVGDYYGYVELFLNGPPVSMALDGSISGGSLNLVWDECVGATAYWVYGADNLPYFEPGLSMPWQYRLASVPAGTTTWSTTDGIGDPDHNWTYQVVAIESASNDISRTNRLGEFDFDTGN